VASVLGLSWKTTEILVSIGQLDKNQKSGSDSGWGSSVQNCCRWWWCYEINWLKVVWTQLNVKRMIF